MNYLVSRTKPCGNESLMHLYQCKSRGGGGGRDWGGDLTKTDVRKLIKCPQGGTKIPVK
jgi:hypothetical protein